jgi:hypothetical protein
VRTVFHTGRLLKQNGPLLRRHSKSSRQYFNVLVAGHRQNRLPQSSEQQEYIRKVLFRVLDKALQEAQDHGLILRLFTGWSDGTDHFARNWFKQNHPLNNQAAPQCYIVSPDEPPPASLEQQITGFVGISAKPSDIPETWYGITDDYKLLMADFVVSVWDGKPAAGYEGGTVYLVARALRRHMPVVWIHADEASLGQVEIADTSTHPDAEIALINTRDAASLIRFFTSSQKKTEDFGIDAIFNEAADLTLTSFVEEGLGISAKDDPQQRKKHAGFWYASFFWLLAPQKIKSVCFAPVRSWRGPEAYVQVSALSKRFWETFDRLDRTATHASNRYRDAVVLTHLASSLAVFSAVASTILLPDFPATLWAVLEWAMLSLVLILVLRSQGSKHRISTRDTWLLARQAAEMMRASALLYPHLDSLQGLYEFSSPGLNAKTMDNKTAARLLVIHNLRDAEVPSTDVGATYWLEDHFLPLKQALLALIHDQRKYHESTTEKYETWQHHIHRLTQLVFFIVLGVVLVHVLVSASLSLVPENYGLLATLGRVMDKPEWLLLSASFPALAAALHGIQGTLELKRIAERSKHMAQKLEELHGIVEKCHDDPIKLRQLAIMTAETIFSEHDSWRELMSAQQVGIPA